MKRVIQIEVCFSGFRWAFQEDRREEILAHFEERRRSTPELWNGKVLLMNGFEIDGEVLRGTYFEASYASFLAWCDWGFPDPAINNCFPVGALRSRDGAFLLGVMNDHTAHHGDIYFPAGMPDLNDVTGGTVDLMGNILREIEEETGLTTKNFSIGSGWCAVDTNAPHINVIKPINLRYPANEAREMIMHHLQRRDRQELKDIRIVRSVADFDSHMHGYVITYISHMLNKEEGQV